MTNAMSKIKRFLSESFIFHLLRLFILSYKFFVLFIFISLIGIISPLLMSQIAGENFNEAALMSQLSAINPQYHPTFTDSDINNIMDMAYRHSTMLPLGILQGFTFGGMVATTMASTIGPKYVEQWTFGYTTGGVPFAKYGEPLVVDMGGFLLGHIPHGLIELPVLLFIFACALMFGNYCYFRVKELVKKYIKFYPDILSLIVYGFVFGMSIKLVADNTGGLVGGVLIGIACLLIGNSLEDEYRKTTFSDIIKSFLAIAIPFVILLIVAAAVEIMLDWKIIYNYFARASLSGAVGTYSMTLFWYGVHLYALKWVYGKGKSLQASKLDF